MESESNFEVTNAPPRGSYAMMPCFGGPADQKWAFLPKEANYLFECGSGTPYTICAGVFEKTGKAEYWWAATESKFSSLRDHDVLAAYGIK